jgi:hypothetical protein
MLYLKRLLLNDYEVVRSNSELDFIVPDFSSENIVGVPADFVLN